MQWRGRRQSSNVEDRRGMSNGGKLVTGGGVIGVIFLLVQMFMGGDAGDILAQLTQQSSGGTPTEKRDLTKEEIEQREFTSTVFADTEDVWANVFKNANQSYRKPGLILFEDAVSTGCGQASSSTGPFYCPADEKVYVDLTFMNELKTRFGAEGGDFATAYVIAHEVGHHIQTLMGTSADVTRQQQNLSTTEANKLSVALELQADFYAGIFAHYDKKYLDDGDIEEAMSAANAVGDDAIQEKVQGRVVPDAFTHGTSKQRMYWFMKGYNSGDVNQGNTFAELAN
ncbi:MAG: neutral zinc metallopeptidase [Pelobium sp.]